MCLVNASLRLSNYDSLDIHTSKSLYCINIAIRTDLVECT